MTNEVDARPSGGSLPGLFVAMRPRQWTKNLLVAAAPLAAGELFEADVLRAVAVTFVVFCLASSAVYLLNDAVDVDADRAHPSKRRRPVATGAVSVRTAIVCSVVLGVVAVALAVLALDTDVVWLLLGYLALSVAYCFWLKHEAVLDIAVVAAGFLIRAMAGGLATDIPLSQWFLIVAAFGSLFMVAGKRYSELVTLGDDAGRSRRPLEVYSPTYLRFVWGIAAGVTITAYCLWAFEVGARTGDVAWAPLSVAPFVLALLRYAIDIDHGRAGEPEEIVARDHVLQALGLLWLACFALAAFGG